MNEKSRKELKEWWNNCPSKKITVLMSLLVILIGLNCSYELGIGFGHFLYNIMH